MGHIGFKLPGRLGNCRPVWQVAEVSAGQRLEIELGTQLHRLTLSGWGSWASTGIPKWHCSGTSKGFRQEPPNHNLWGFTFHPDFPFSS